MIPLSLAGIGEVNVIRSIGGGADIKKRLAGMGFTLGGTVTVISENEGNLIVDVKGVRVALGADIANRIMI